MKNKNENSSHWGEMVKSLANGFLKKMSFDLIIGVKEQWDKFLFKTRSGVIAILFAMFGLVFVAVGLAIFIGSIFQNLPGVGFVIVGVGLALIGWVASLVKKMI